MLRALGDLAWGRCVTVDSANVSAAQRSPRELPAYAHRTGGRAVSVCGVVRRVDGAVRELDGHGVVAHGGRGAVVRDDGGVGDVPGVAAVRADYGLDAEGHALMAEGAEQPSICQL